ncbi:hypothetical protein MIB92_07340 [Aestuariirhabdus sp. Z084]|uniref:thiosulfate oxidation carrier protein SoxY n=1 Tax=Aestuariirhabdus haliotis TaxID=2918751 RepID=UPI00201B3B1F|nr:thiosulfate oxidation carrier protein SoxY [Aestuariirhabdus haliotis]MCL6415459.1 hypothetical protein [Aestuariirhabdus haliotis]MCL6419336.1 hypothetical protein [Aestuariirhabdus haliotis]
MIERRELMLWLAAFPVLSLLVFSPVANGAPRDAKQRLKLLIGEKKPAKGRIKIELPAVTDQGRFVPIKVSVDSPMSDEDYVKAIHIIAERNPSPEVASFYLSPANGRAEISTRIRLLKTQVVLVAAEMNDGSTYLAKGRSKITGGAGGCG